MNAFEAYFAGEAHRAERKTLPLLSTLVGRYSDERPFRGRRVAFGHILVRNSLLLIEALTAGGAQVFLCDAYTSPAATQIHKELRQHGIPIYSVREAAERTDLYLDVSAVLGRHKVPLASAEVTRTGIHHYAEIACPVVSADDCRAKRIEGFFGTGDGFLRAWKLLRPDNSIEIKHIVQFGFGKIGRGVAHYASRAGLDFILVEKDAKVRQRAQEEGFAVLEADASPELEAALKAADVVISVTGIPGVIGKSLPHDWLRANQPVLVNLGAEDEFGPHFEEAEILGGRGVPLNFHLSEPTLNRYIDPPLAAHVMALEAWVSDPEAFPIGIHPLPEEMDDWLLREWRAAWPDEDLTGIEEELFPPN